MASFQDRLSGLKPETPLLWNSLTSFTPRELPFTGMEADRFSFLSHTHKLTFYARKVACEVMQEHMWLILCNLLLLISVMLNLYLSLLFYSFPSIICRRFVCCLWFGFGLGKRLMESCPILAQCQLLFFLHEKKKKRN